MFYQALIVSDSPIVRVGEMLSFPSHWHSEIEVIYCLEGSFAAAVDGRAFDVSAGQTLFVGSAEPHEYSAVAAGTKCLVIEIGAGLLKNDFRTLSERAFAKPVSDTPQEIRRLFDKILTELKQPETAAGKWTITGCLFELSAFMQRGLADNAGASGKKLQRISAIQRVDKVLEYLRENYHKRLTVEDAAKFTGYEKSNFCKQFKTATKMTFHQYLNMVRIGKACILLSSGDDSVGTVAEKTGFPETKTFCRVFKAFMGATPGEYRKTHR